MKNYFKKLSIMFVMLLAVIGFGTIQNETVANAAVVGQQLTQPEIEWNRYDDTDENIEYDGTWSTTNNSSRYKGTTHLTTQKGNSISFKFYGSKIRYISDNYKDYPTNISIKIDNLPVEKFSAATSRSGIYQCLLYQNLNLPLGIHNVTITMPNDGTWTYGIVDAIDIDKNGYLLPYDESISLNKSTTKLTVGDSEQLIAKTTPAAIGVAWTSSDPSIATVDSNGNIIGIKEGQTTITATTTDGSNLSATCIVNVTSNPIVVPPPTQTTSSAVVLNIEPEKPQIHLKETTSANITIDNIKEIAAEDVRIKYDGTRLKFLGMDEVDGIKLVKSENKDGELRLILASKGAINVANAKKVLLKLNFQGIAPGDALVDVTKGRVSDGIEMERDLTDAECGQATIIIDDTIIKDVNNSGEFTLLDLAIDARHLEEDPTTLLQYNTDQVINGAIDNDDLTKIGEYMLANPNYKFN